MDTKEKAFAWVDAHRDEMVDLWREMVSIDSGIGVKEGGMEIGNLCASRLENVGTPSLVKGETSRSRMSF